MCQSWEGSSDADSVYCAIACLDGFVRSISLPLLVCMTLAVALVLGGCGKKGRLYLPKDDAESADVSFLAAHRLPA